MSESLKCLHCGHEYTQPEAPKDVVRERKTEIFFTHLNHTNLALNPEGEARKNVEELGFKIASDDMEFFL